MDESKKSKRAAMIRDLEAFDVPVRKVSTCRDGGSWSAEVYVGDTWVEARHDFAAKTTKIGASIAEVETRLLLSRSD